MLKRYLLLVALVLSFSLTGCASVGKSELPRIDRIDSAMSKKPSLYAELHFYRGKPGSDKAIAVKAAVDQLQPSVASALDRTGVFRSYSFDPATKSTADYQLRFDVYNHGNIGAAMASGFITGLTLGLIPGSATDEYTMNVSLMDRHGRLIRKLANKDAVETRIGIWYIAQMDNTPARAINSTIGNQVMVAVKSLVDDKSIH
ncbi:MAG: hypothetical protein OEX03_12800 [Gammaproteobacteria bacterium]|nr:hypothetical protein [Gammaproteobacteria bacterium]